MKKRNFLGLLALLLCMPTFLVSCKKPNVKESNLTILLEEDSNMINNYTLMAVEANPQNEFYANANAIEKNLVKRSAAINTVGADALINWVLSDEGKNAIKEYGKTQYGEALFTWKDDAPVSTVENVVIPHATDDTKYIELSSTTSVKDSGLLRSILPVFEKNYGYEVKVYAAGTGYAIANAILGNADLILVHSKTQEESFQAAGYARTVNGFASQRLTFMYNYFVLVGPKDDPANVKNAGSVVNAFQAIADNKCKFISRADQSGTHNQEVKIWGKTNVGITADASTYQDKTWYVAAGTGMGACLTQAEERNGYILSDKATFLSYVNNYK